MTAKLLFDEEPLVVQPTLAALIGLQEAIIVQQLHYWLRKSEHFHDGRYWIYNTYDDWVDQFKFFSKRTLERLIPKLEKSGIILTGNYNKAGFDNTKWYSLNYDELNRLRECVDDTAKVAGRNRQSSGKDTAKVAGRTSQNGGLDTAKVAGPIPEITTETNSENNQRLKTPTPTSAGDASLIWSRCLEQVAKKLSEATFQTWFGNTKGYDFTEKTLTVVVPNEFAKEWIESRYFTVVNDSLKALSKGQEIKVQFILGQDERGAGDHDQV